MKGNNTLLNAILKELANPQTNYDILNDIDIPEFEIPQLEIDIPEFEIPQLEIDIPEFEILQLDIEPMPPLEIANEQPP